MSLADRLKAQIQDAGPLSVAQYMTACLHDPAEGYYATRPAIGGEGDFITAPTVSQMFGELLGLWAAEVWERLGRPAQVALVEMGPGEGVMMGDMLRAARAAPGFLDAAGVWLVETSQPLRARQAARLGDAPVSVQWARDLDGVPDDRPIILVANELLDCLPVQQFVRTGRGWAQRMVGLDDAGALSFGLQPAPEFEAHFPDAPVGSLLERSPAQEALGGALAARVVAQAGAALLVDYGRDGPAFGDTLQALRAHRKVDPLEGPGQADLTAHADFPSVLARAAEAGGAVTPILGQGEFLRRLGIEARAAALSQSRPDMAEILARQLQRLTGPDQMGRLFKACAIHSPGLAAPGFEEA
jgi:NADH dehydrogenase [ubiquinone] 1 alpha subcomplex assembly factor 7